MFTIGMIATLCAGCKSSATQESEVVDESIPPVTQEYYEVSIPDPYNSNPFVEVAWWPPQGRGPFPAIVYVHGHSDKVPAPGAMEHDFFPRYRKWVDQGFVVIALSQPGYGRTPGPRDFCGPKSQNATRAAIRFAEHLTDGNGEKLVNPDQIFLFGRSRGAMVASMVATQEPNLAGVILISGLYHLQNLYNFTSLPGMKNLILSESGLSKSKIIERSILANNQYTKIKAPVFISHATRDPRTSHQDALALHRGLLNSGKSSKLVSIPSDDHGFSYKLIDTELDDFFKLP